MKKYPLYDFSAKRADYAATGHDTHKRRAIRTVRAILRNLAPGARGEVRVRAPGKTRGALVYQAHTDATGNIIAEEL